MAKHETKKMKMIEKAVGYQLQKERLEQQNKRTASYGSYLSSYDLGQAPVKFPGAYPSPKLLLEEIQKAN
ncbi:MAG: hypothetical protein Q8O99_05130 [bacterium]|nr:hypothetical protein [bacterium]